MALKQGQESVDGVCIEPHEGGCDVLIRTRMKPITCMQKGGGKGKFSFIF
jgi:hypothetical protein